MTEDKETSKPNLPTQFIAILLNTYSYNEVYDLVKDEDFPEDFKNLVKETRDRFQLKTRNIEFSRFNIKNQEIEYLEVLNCVLRKKDWTLFARMFTAIYYTLLIYIINDKDPNRHPWDWVDKKGTLMVEDKNLNRSKPVSNSQMFRFIKQNYFGFENDIQLTSEEFSLLNMCNLYSNVRNEIAHHYAITDDYLSESLEYTNKKGQNKKYPHRIIYEKFPRDIFYGMKKYFERQTGEEVSGLYHEINQEILEKLEPNN